MSQVLDEVSDDGVLLITLNRPEVLNAWTPDMERRFFELIGLAQSDPAVRVIVVTEAGRGFCAGADLTQAADELVTAGPVLPGRHRGHYPPTTVKPVIAAINGGCAGVGLAVALWADIRFVAADAKLTAAFSRRGLVAEHGVAWLLPRIVGRGRALDLLLSARVFTGADAGSYGLAEFVSPREEVLPDALRYAHELATQCSPRAMAATKQQVLDDERTSAFNSLLAADELTRASYTWSDLQEGISAWQARRAPDFPPLPPDGR